MLHVKRTGAVLDVLLFGAATVLFLASAVLRWMGSGYISGAFYLMVFGVLFFNAGALFHSLSHIYRDISFLLFLIAYNILLLGRVYFNCIYYRHKILTALEADSWENLYTAMAIVTTGLVVFTIAYYAVGLLFTKRERQMQKSRGKVDMHAYIPVLRQISKVILYVTSIPYFYVMVLRILAVMKDGYTVSFTKTVDIPGVISRLAALFVPSFAVFLGTLPSLKEMKLPLLVYGIYMVASLLTGRRNMMVTEAFMLFVYFVMRDYRRAKTKRYFTPKTVAVCIVVVIIAAYLLQVMAMKRAGKSMAGHSFISMLISFVDSQGASFRVVVQTVNIHSFFNPNVTWMYLFYPFELFAHNNRVIASLFGLQPIVEVQNEGFAKTTHNFAHVLTYKVDPQRYENGGGFGTSFIAEAYVAGGIAAVILLVILIAVLFRFMSSILTRGWAVIAFGMLAFRHLIYLPRSFAFTWITDTFSITNIVYFTALFAVSLLIVQISAKVYPLRRHEKPAVCPDKASQSLNLSEVK